MNDPNLWAESIKKIIPDDNDEVDADDDINNEKEFWKIFCQKYSFLFRHWSHALFLLLWHLVVHSI